MKIVITLTTTGTITFEDDTRVRKIFMFANISIKILLLGLVVDGMYSDDATK